LPGCQKDVGSGMLQSPAFSLTFEVDQVKHQITAGENGGFLETNLLIAPNGVPTYFGQLMNKLQPSQPKLSIALLQSADSGQFNLAAYREIPTRTLYSRVNATRPGNDLMVRLVPKFPHGSLVSNILWRIDHQSTTFSSLLNPFFQVDLDQYPTARVRLSVIYQDGCQHEVRHFLDFFNVDLKPNFEIRNESGSYYEMKRLEDAIFEPSQTIWEHNLLEIGTGNQVFVPKIHGNHLVRMRVATARGTVETDREFFADSSSQYHICPIDFDIHIEPHPDINFFKFDQVLITYTDASGHQYSSAYLTQAYEIALSDFEYFMENEKGQKTIRFKCSGSFPLSDPNGNTIFINNLNGYFGVAVPN
jgi:hypothetical protein